PSVDGVASQKLPRYRCAACGARITAAEYLFAPNGAGPERAFTNPEGVICEITCFTAAWGLVFSASAESLHTWFAGYLWRIASCQSCHIHMGWRFEADSGQEPPWFFGLLSRRIVPGAD
ncbi:MAG TPA: cereblon family protein, partial [Polyangiaceae bacterium]|nr:cereblon family protein [Polyangiaceae bacterium]